MHNPYASLLNVWLACSWRQSFSHAHAQSRMHVRWMYDWHARDVNLSYMHMHNPVCMFDACMIGMLVMYCWWIKVHLSPLFSPLSTPSQHTLSHAHVHVQVSLLTLNWIWLRVNKESSFEYFSFLWILVLFFLFRHSWQIQLLTHMRPCTWKNNFHPSWIGFYHCISIVKN